MSGQKYRQFTLYSAEAEIPRHQRAWVWGVAALLILLCGLMVGGLLGRVSIPFISGMSASGSFDSEALLTRQQAMNEELRIRIARLDQALGGDACSTTALDALSPKEQQ